MTVIILFVVVLCLGIYSTAMTLRAIRARKLCKCGAQAGGFNAITDTPLRIFEREGRTHASRWGDDIFARLTTPPEILRDDEI
jgi:hypothetical protein